MNKIINYNIIIIGCCKNIKKCFYNYKLLLKEFEVNEKNKKCICENIKENDYLNIYLKK
jgi:hypothetical protein